MARSARDDFPGAIHHVMNRGIAKRPLFEGERDVRRFLAALAAAVRRKEIRVLVYCFMTTHFHLVVESTGRLSDAMARIQRDYVRWFNRGRRRDGSLVRGRFRSKLVVSEAYWRCLIAYIDRNPVSAKLVDEPWKHPHGSARHFASGRFPRWFDSRPVARVFGGTDEWTPAAATNYRASYLRSGDAADTILRRAIDAPGSRDPWADIGSVTPNSVIAWMRQKARLADGGLIGAPLAREADVRTVIAGERKLRPRIFVTQARVARDAWELIEVALLRDIAAARWSNIARALKSSIGYAVARYCDHCSAMLSDEAYANDVLRVAQTVLATIGQQVENSFGRVGIRPDVASE